MLPFIEMNLFLFGELEVSIIIIPLSLKRAARRKGQRDRREPIGLMSQKNLISFVSCRLTNISLQLNS